ncbi:muscle M-line assembly protein unc-89-like isoform X3 [Ruditapes philippinarum]|uniref:muscle M-line assembly protein unc-89-like isoform X3 n=1 Tax=Ruditapes philippinarum TaxID=129788 RepID=UPI00295B4BCE|nr:muscle M-line assembly protein unc-89-like isoform X3 [Ruditapes philippinarum]
MEKYANYSSSTLEEMLAACKDFKERHHIRSALREIKGLKHDGSDLITYSFGSRTLKNSSSETSPRKHQLLLNQSAKDNRSNDSRTYPKKEKDFKISSDAKPLGENAIKFNNKLDENGIEKPHFRSYLYAGTLNSPRNSTSSNSPKNSPRGKKDSKSPRKVHTAITRVKVLDKFELVDKCTETAEGVIDSKAETKVLKSVKDKIKTSDRKERIKRYESTPLPQKERKENGEEWFKSGKEVLNSDKEGPKGDNEELDISAIEFSGDLEKVKLTSVLHRPVSVNSSSLYGNHSRSPRSPTSPVISSPRKPRKIVSYRTSAFSPTSKLSPVSSTISRARLRSAPPISNKSSDSVESNNSLERKIPLDDLSCNYTKPKELKVVEEDERNINTKIVKTSAIQGNSERVPGLGLGNVSSGNTEKLTDTQERIFIAKPIEIKREEDQNLVVRLRNKLNSKQNTDLKSEILELNYFTNKMKEKHGRKNKTEDNFIVLSPLKDNDPYHEVGENEVECDANVISNYTNNKAKTMEEAVDNDLVKKKPGLSRKNRIDSDEHKHYQKYRKKKKEAQEERDTCTIKNSRSDEKRSVVTEFSPRKAGKSGSVRRKLPEIPVKHDNEHEDDETVHQRTIRLLQERRKERRGKIAIEKEVTEKLDKSKMSPADFKKTLEQKLERSDSKRKANRVRRELQLLNRESELKSASGNKSDDDTVSSSDKTDNEISAILNSKGTDKSIKDNKKPVQRSKSDIVRRRRAVSETDALVNEVDNNVDQDHAETEKNVLAMFEVDEPLTPMGKIELIGTLMQEEARLQEMLRKSTNFSEKRKMRAEVRLLRQRRMALEGTSDQPRFTSLRRSASVTAGVVTHATPVFITACEDTNKKRPNEDNSQSNIEELRKKLGETQDYDEKKKIRLALRQLRQQNREGPPSGLQRSQSFILQRSSEPVVNGDGHGKSNALRSQSVTGKHDTDKTNGQVHAKSQGTVTNGDVVHNKNEVLKRSEVDSGEHIVAKPVQRHSSFNAGRWKESEKLSEEVTNNLKNLRESVFQNKAACESGLLKRSTSQVSNVQDITESNGRLRHSESDRIRKKSGDTDIINTVPNDKCDNSQRSFKRSSSNESGKESSQNKTGVSLSDSKKPVDFLKETVTKLENQKKNRILEKCEIFEKADKKKSVNEVKPSNRKEEINNDKGKSKGHHILVSRADVERNKQSKLVNLRRDRSNSEPHIKSVSSGTSSKKNKPDVIDKTNKCESDNSNVTTVKSSERSLVEEVVDGNTELDVKIGNKVSDSNNHLTASPENDTRLSPSLLWLEEKRKSLPLLKDIDKFMSTMDIEAAFSEILGAVEEFPEQNEVSDVLTTDGPILEEENCDSSELEEDSKGSFSNDISGDNEIAVDVKKETINNEINDKVEEVEKGDGENDGSSAIQQSSGIKKSQAKIELSSNLSLDLTAKTDDHGAISVIHGDDGTVTVQEVSQVQEGDTTITEWKKLRRTQSRTETRETDTVVEKKITSPGGSSSVYEKDVSKTKHKLTSRGSNYFTRNNYNIKRKKDLDGTELVEHDLSSVTENMSVTKNETWGDKSEAKVVLSREQADDSELQIKSIQDSMEGSDIDKKPEDKIILKRGPSLCEDTVSSHVDAVHKHLGRPLGCPEVKATLKETSALEGEAILLNCTVVSSPAPTIVWYRGDNRLYDGVDGVRLEFNEETGDASLKIHPVSLKDAGEYKCVFENSLGTATTKGRLLVKRKSSGVPSFMSELTDVTINEGNSLCLECQLSDTDVVTWSKDGITLLSNADFKQTFDGTKARLEIAEVFLDDCGIYTCTIKNSTGDKKCSCTVTVKESESPDVVYPIFLKKPETTIANERDPVIIDCEVIGSPEVNVTWYHNGSKVKEDAYHRTSYDGRVAMLVVRKVSPKDGGKIECVAENSSGKVSAECRLVIQALKSAPSVIEELFDVTVISGKKATLKCLINGEPKPEITWRKNGLVIGQTLDFKQTQNEDVVELEIAETCIKDTGCYECMARNEKGEVTTSCQLTVQDDSLQAEKTVTAEVDKQHATVQEEKTQTASLKTFTSKFVPNIDSEQVNAAKSQASKVMLVRQGSLRSLRQEKSDKPLVRTGSFQSIDTVIKNGESKKFEDMEKVDKSPRVVDKSVSDRQSEENVEKVTVKEVPKVEVDVNKNYAGKLNANLADKIKNDIDVKPHSRDIDNNVKTVNAGSGLSSLCLESSNVKEVKPLAKFRAGGEIRRSQSVRSAGSEKPEWLQVKLRKVGSKPSPLAMEREKSITPSQDSSNQETVVQNEIPVSVQREVKLSRSQSARIVDRNTSLALRDSTNSPSSQTNRDSTKLTPVSERAKIFQMRDSSSSGSSSGKSSPVDIISKAINLSRTESLRSPLGNRSLGVQRSQSFKTVSPSPSPGDVTLELTPQNAKKEEEKTACGSSRKFVQYWDPSAPSTSNMDYSTITDEEKLNDLLSKSDNFDERKKIRARIKEVRDQHMKEWEAKRAARHVETEDPIKRKHREADLMKQKKMEQFQKQAADHHESKHLDLAEQQLRERMKLADEQKKKTMQEFSGRAATHQDSAHLDISERALQEKIKQADLLKKKTLESYDQAAGKTGMSQTSTVKTEVTRDGKTVTTTRKVETVTKVGGASKPSEDQLAQQIIKAAGSVSGVLTVKTESWSSKDNVTHTSEKTETWGGRGGAMNAFKAMDAKNAPKTNPLVAYTFAKRAANTFKRNAVSIKQDVLNFVKINTAEYSEIIEITNFSTSWNNGIAFCALIHHFYPDAFDIHSLDPKQRRKNFELAFDTAEKLADIAPLLDVEDMVRMQKPDWKCVFTYVQSFYRKLNSHERNKAVA